MAAHTASVIAPPTNVARADERKRCACASIEWMMVAVLQKLQRRDQRQIRRIAQHRLKRPQAGAEEPSGRQHPIKDNI